MEPKELPLVTNHPVDPDTSVTVLSVLLDDTIAYVDPGALHGSSSVEVEIEFSDDHKNNTDLLPFHVLWIGIRAGADGIDGYYSIVGSQLYINKEIGIGWRPTTHFTDMISAIQGTVRIDDLSIGQQELLRGTLYKHNSEMWNHRSEGLRNIWPN